ncbi:MAG: hypothetical protein AB7P69_06035 [Candidatus Binatia bacterium]
MCASTAAKFIAYGAFLGALWNPTIPVLAADGYPADYKPSTPAEKGETNILNRAVAIATYMNDKLTAAGGNDSAMCYRNCITIPYNDVLKCMEAKGSYAASESCEKDAANKMAACDPKCK